MFEFLCLSFQALDVVISTSNVSVTERDSLDLTCNITTDRSGIFQAEVMWYFSASPDDTLSDAQLLLSMDHDSVVSDSTLISLSHVDRNSYRLLVRDVDVEDSGYYFCEAAIWVPLHNGSWHKVVERTSAPVSVVVTALGERFCCQTSWVMYPSILGPIRKERGPCRISSAEVFLLFPSIIYM